MRGAVRGTQMSMILHKLISYTYQRRRDFQKILNPVNIRGLVPSPWTNEGGGAQMTTTLNNSYLVKVFT